MATPQPPGDDEFKDKDLRKKSKDDKETKDAPLTPGFRQRVEDDAHKRQSDLNPDPDRAPEGTKRERDRP